MARLWTLILGDVPLEGLVLTGSVPTPHHPPQPDEWHHHYVKAMEHSSKDGKWLFLARGVAENEAWVYPSFADVDMSYIRQLKTPALTAEDYDALFRRAEENVAAVWGELGRALTAREPQLLALVNGNLDTGMADGAVAGSKPIFWAT